MEAKFIKLTILNNPENTLLSVLEFTRVWKGCYSATSSLIKLCYKLTNYLLLN